MRIEVDRFGPERRTTVVYAGDPDPALAELLRPVVDQAVGELADRAGLPRRTAAELLLCEVVERFGDEAAFERESARRGRLAL